MRGPDRPRAKALAVPLGSRRWCFGPMQQKKRPDLGLVFNTKPDRPNAGCCIGQECAVPKITCDVGDRKPAQTRQKKNLDFFLVESTEAQPGATDRHREAPMRLNSNTSKNGHFSLAGQSTAPLARGRSCGCCVRARSSERRRSGEGGSRAREERERATPRARTVVDSPRG